VTRARPGVPATGLLILVLLTGFAVGACGTVTSSPSPTPASSDTPAPRATPWTGNAVLGIEAMGIADGEIRKGMDDFNAGVQASDPARMRDAAIGLARVDVLLVNVDRIEPFEPMREFAADYRAAITAMSGAARELQAALEAGDGSATTAASRKLIDGFTKYVALQGPLAEYVVQVPEQKRILVR
jgi:hypothetical protein